MISLAHNHIISGKISLIGTVPLAAWRRGKDVNAWLTCAMVTAVKMRETARAAFVLPTAFEYHGGIGRLGEAWPAGICSAHARSDVTQHWRILLGSGDGEKADT